MPNCVTIWILRLGLRCYTEVVSWLPTYSTRVFAKKLWEVRTIIFYSQKFITIIRPSKKRLFPSPKCAAVSIAVVLKFWQSLTNKCFQKTTFIASYVYNYFCDWLVLVLVVVFIIFWFTGISRWFNVLVF